MIHQVWTSQVCGQWICKDYECQALSLLSHQSGRLATTIIIIIKAELMSNGLTKICNFHLYIFLICFE